MRKKEQISAFFVEFRKNLFDTKDTAKNAEKMSKLRAKIDAYSKQKLSTGKANTNILIVIKLFCS